MEERKEKRGGLIDETDNKKSIVNLSIIIAVAFGFLLLSYCVYKDKKDAYFPISSIISVALGGVAVKANRKTS